MVIPLTPESLGSGNNKRSLRQPSDYVPPYAGVNGIYGHDWSARVPGLSIPSGSSQSCDALLGPFDIYCVIEYPICPFLPAQIVSFFSQRPTNSFCIARSPAKLGV